MMELVDEAEKIAAQARLRRIFERGRCLNNRTPDRQLLHQNLKVLVRFSNGGITGGQRWGGDDRARMLPQVRDGCRSGRMISLADGGERISSFCSVVGYPLSVSVSVGWDDALADARTTMLRYRVAGVLLLVLLGCGTWIMLALLQRQRTVRSALRDSEAGA